MASFFGEVTALSSRADVEEEEENEVETNYNITVEYASQINNNAVNVILFSVGTIASAFVKNYLIHSVKPQPIGFLRCVMNRNDCDEDVASNLGLSYVRHPINNLATLYLGNKNILICDVNDSIPEEMNIDLCQKVLSCFPVNQAIVLATYHKAAYKSNTVVEKSFLKALGTESFLENNVCNIPLLPLPNIVSKFPGAVLAEFEVKGKVAVAFIHYAETMSLDSLNVSMFESILKEKVVSDNVSVNEDAEERLQSYLRSKQRGQSNLYI